MEGEYAATVQTADYHIFLTAYGETQGLHVTSQSATGFAVAEGNGGTGNVTFSWRVMAKRADIVGERLPRVALPPMHVLDEKDLAPLVREAGGAGGVAVLPGRKPERGVQRRVPIVATPQAAPQAPAVVPPAAPTVAAPTAAAPTAAGGGSPAPVPPRRP